MKPTKVSKKLQRTALRTSRLLDFVSRKELVAQIGHPPAAWPLVLIKELVDNGLDACEEAGIAPEISIQVDEDSILVTDNGPGIPPEIVADVLDFSSRVSSREAYVAPDRGAQGNALKTLVAMPFVLNGEKGRVDMTARGIRHQITLRVDRIRQEPVVDHQQQRDQLVKNGTCVRVYWPNSPSPTTGDENGQNLQDGDEETECDPIQLVGSILFPDDDLVRSLFLSDDDLEKIDVIEDNSPSSILQAARARFLQLAQDFTFLNPHLALTVDWHGERFSVAAGNPAWRKWVPSDPTCAHWYEPEHFQRLVAGYIAHDMENDRDRTVRELVAEFSGLSSTAKQKKVLDATGLARTNLSALVKGDGLDTEKLGSLLAAMKTHCKSIKPAALGLIGKEHLAARFKAVGCEMDTFQYRKVAGETDSVPWVVETAFGWCPESNGRRIVTGVNWSPGIVNPFRELGRFGDSLDSLLERQWAGDDEPVVLVLHLACPRVEYTDRGKSAVVVH